MQEKRSEWKESMFQKNKGQLVFLDESGVNTNLTRCYARGIGKERVTDSTPVNTPRTTTVLSSIRLNGEKAFVDYAGGTSGAVFIRYIKDTLIPTLHQGDIVIMDNMRSHHVKEVKELFDEAGIQYCYLPAYSPDLNPIEKMWSKMKSILRKLKIRNVEKLPIAISYALSLVTTSDCKGWFTTCGYCL